MSRPQTLLSLLAVILASSAAIVSRGRLVFAVVAVVVLLLVVASLLRGALTKRRSAPAFDRYERVARIREARDRQRRR